VTADKLLYKIHITGRVQGVGFRWSTFREAGRKGITGLVKNCPDGSVYIEAEGVKEQLDDFINWCRAGPVNGFVKSVSVEVCSPAGYREFRVEY
jgi:acylphosphatase